MEPEREGKLPDAVLAVITQLILGVSLATSAVPPTVLSVQDRASETIGVLIVLAITAGVALPLRAAFGALDSTSSEFMLAVLAPLITRIDLALLIWVNVNKALLWAEQMLYATKEELDCVALLVLASKVWHDGENRLKDPEFGYYGGDSAMVMYRLQRDYNPRNAEGKLLALLGHVTLWPFAIIFHILLQIISAIGFVPFWFLAWLAHATSGKSRKAVVSRGSFWGFLLNRPYEHARKLFLQPRAAAVFDSNQHIVKSSRRQVRQKWAMLGTVDAILQHGHFSRVLSAIYPMRAVQVMLRARADPVCNDVMSLRNKEDIFYKDFPDAPMVQVGEQVSKQILVYRVMAWPAASEYSSRVLEKLQNFAESNTEAWRETEKWLSEKGANDAKSEFISVRDVVRKILVQMIVLAWCDGLGELYHSGATNIAEELNSWFLKSSFQSLEMAIRLCNISSDWIDHRQNSSMIISLRTKTVEDGWDDCSCDICEEIAKKRTIKGDRYGTKPSGEELESALTAAGCRNAKGIANVWKRAVLEWFDMFERDDAQRIV